MYIEKLSDLMEKASGYEGANFFKQYDISNNVLTKLTKNSIKEYSIASQVEKNYYDIKYPQVVDYLKSATIVLLQEIPVANPQYN